MDIEISNGFFRWCDPPEIPLTANEKAELQKEANKRKKESDIAEAMTRNEEKRKKYLIDDQ